MKIEKVSNLAVKVFVPYSITILVETPKDEIDLKSAAQRIKNSIYPSTQTIGDQILQAMKPV